LLHQILLCTKIFLLHVSLLKKIRCKKLLSCPQAKQSKPLGLLIIQSSLNPLPPHQTSTNTHNRNRHRHRQREREYTLHTTHRVLRERERKKVGSKLRVLWLSYYYYLDLIEKKKKDTQRFEEDSFLFVTVAASLSLSLWVGHWVIVVCCCCCCCFFFFIHV
jgi:hypothetical protein